MTQKLDNVAVVLHRPKLSENIGTAVRAAANMGLGRVIVVDPGQFEPKIIQGAATRAALDLVDDIWVAADLDQALAEFQYVVGTTARMGSHRGPFLSPRQIARQVMDLGPVTKTALLFGPEPTGLTTAQLRLCQAVVRIPTAGLKVASLNLAQAVLIMGYELLLASEPEAAPYRIMPAPISEVQSVYKRLNETFLAIGFLPSHNTDHWLMSFKRIFNRSGLTHGECNLLLGLCRQIDWVLRTGGKKEQD
ncbi:MAG: TrmH family RNA methyltransferase [Pseudomonadota bacterium]